MPRAILLVLNDFINPVTREIALAHGVSIGSADPCPQDWIPCRDQAEAVRLQAWIHDLMCPTCDGTTFEDPAPGAWFWKCAICLSQIAPDDDVSSSFERATGARVKATDTLASGMTALYAANADMSRLRKVIPQW